MHISDMLGQYNRNISSGTEELKAASGMQKVVSTLEELSSGSVFEGTVSSVKNGKVTLALSDGQTQDCLEKCRFRRERRCFFR